MVPVVLAGMALAGTALSVYGQMKEAKSKAEAAERDAYLKGLQADEMMERQAINEDIMREQNERAGLQYQARFAGTGREGGGIGGILEMRRVLNRNIELSRRDAQFKASMLRAGAESDQKLASDFMTSGYITGAGTALTGATRAYGVYHDYGPASTNSKGMDWGAGTDYGKSSWASGVA